MMSLSNLHDTDLIQSLLDGNHLNEDEAYALFTKVVRGELDDVLLASAITAIKVRGETIDELAGAAKALVESATPFPRPEYPFADVVGTGGDGHNTINLSTIAAITAACCGVKIIKHGNRSISSCSGSFDLLETLGVDFSLAPQQARQCVDAQGICFLFAPQYHSGLKHAAPARKTLKVRTIFNLLGPLVNPARPPMILLGVAKPEIMEPVAAVLLRMGCDRGMVVHGSGVDEVAIHGPTSVVELRSGQLKTFQLSPADFGAAEHELNTLTCQVAQESHRRSIAVLEGRGSSAENAAVGVNVATVMSLFGNSDLKANYAQALDVLRSGQPMQLVQRIVQASPTCRRS